MTTELKEREIAIIMTIVKMIETNREKQIQPSDSNVRYWFDTYLEMNRRTLTPPAPPA